MEKNFGNRYQIIEKVGTGGMAEVYKAKDTVLEREVALKVLHAQFAKEENFRARFKREAQAAANLNHPNIVNIFDWGKQDETYFIVMEFLGRKNLKQVISEKGPLAPEEIVKIGQQVCSALAAAHENNVIHRDIKPHNIILAAEGVKVTDFGIARAGTSTMTQTGTILGTAQYTSPEQAQGSSTDARSDLYSLGIVLFEMLTGEVPFQGENPVAIAMKQISETPPRPSSLRPGLPEELEKIVLKLLAKNPNHRYSSAEELKEDLDRFTLGRPVEAVIPSEEATQVITRPREGLAEKPQPQRKTRRSRRILLVIGVFLLLLLIGAAAAWSTYLFLKPKTATVPDIRGKSLDEAKKILKEKNLRLKVTSKTFHNTVPKDHIISQDPSPKGEIEENSVVRVVISKGIQQVTVPDLIGEAIEDAGYFIAQAELAKGETKRIYSDKPEGTVITQDPSPGKKVPKGTRVNLTVSRGLRKVEVPDVTGKSEAEAATLLGQAHLNISTAKEFSSEVEKGLVIRQSPSPGTKVNRDTTVEVVVSLGKEMVKIPDVVNLTKDEATKNLEDLGFGVSSRGTGDTVLAQIPESGKEIEKGSTVTIILEPAVPEP